MQERVCFECGAQIQAAFSSTVAGDFLLAKEGKLPWEKVRERCGLCTEAGILLREGLILKKPKIVKGKIIKE